MRSGSRRGLALRILIDELPEPPHGHLEPIQPEIAHGRWKIGVIAPVVCSARHHARSTAVLVTQGAARHCDPGTVWTARNDARPFSVARAGPVRRAAWR